MKKKILGCFCIILIGAILLWFAQMLLMPKYMSDNREGALVAEYYNETTNHDVLFLGDCEVYESLTPPILWEEYGITSYIRGTPQQLIWQSYYLLEDTLRRETPKAVVYNVYAMCYGEPQNDAYNRITLDGMEFSAVKMRAIGASMTEEETMLSYLFPLLRYHDRWDELTKDDWKYMFHRDQVSHNGYLMQTEVKPMTLVSEGRPLSDYTLPAICFEYLDRMKSLCDEKGIELILMKAPTNFWRYYWYGEWDAQICDYAEKNGLSYYNFIPLAEEMGLDWQTDTYDAGAHLNVYGAEKFTSYFGELLKEKHGLSDHREDGNLSAIWNEKVNIYYNERNG